MLAWCWCS